MSSSLNNTTCNVEVAIVGAGFCGTMVAVHLLRCSTPSPTVALIERNGSFGRGIAYGTNDPSHLLNVPAGKMGAFPDDPEHFWKWLRAHPELLKDTEKDAFSPGSFVSRVTYGDYLEALLNDADNASGLLKRIREEAVDVVPLRDGTFRILLGDGRQIDAQKVVLALGNFPPGDPLLRERKFHNSPFYLHTPWNQATRDLLAAPGDILILGSGLTGLDLLLSLSRTKHEGTIHVLSRRGLFPHPHRPYPVYPPFLASDRLPKTARKLLHDVRTEVKRAIEHGIDWRAVIDSMRPFNQSIWRGLSLAERRRFMRHLRSYWEPHRHRAAPQALAVKQKLESEGRLVCHRGRVTAIAETENGLQVEYQARKLKLPVVLAVRYVINCTGPECNYHKLKDPLIVQLFARGLIYPDPLLLGIDVGTGGVLHDARGERVPNLHTLGSPQKGRLFETTAVPELRVQAKHLAQRIIQELAANENYPSKSHLPDPAYAYEI